MQFKKQGETNIMSNLGSLGALKAKRDAIEEARNRPKAAWFRPPKDGSAVKIQFLNELDPEAENYNAAWGTHMVATEHQAPGPKGYMSRALDTMERDGRDWAQEQHMKDYKAGWKPRNNFYINVAVEQDGEVEAQILSRNLTNQFVADLIEEYEESDGVGITGQTYLLKRVGTGTNTQWRIKKSNEPMDLSGVEPWNLEENAVRYVPYEKQEEFYMRNAQLPESSYASSSSSESTSSESDEKDWDW